MSDVGEWPTVDWFYDRENNAFMVIRPDEVPEGKHLEIDEEGNVTVVDDA